MERHTLHDFLAIDLFLLVPAGLILIQSITTMDTLTWIRALPPFQKALIAPFFSFGWEFLLPNLTAYTFLAAGILLIAGRNGRIRAAQVFAAVLIGGPVITAMAKIVVGSQNTALGFSGIVFALGGILTFSLFRSLDTLPRRYALPAAILLTACTALVLLIPAEYPLAGGWIFRTDTLGHWCGFLVGAGTAVLLPLHGLRHQGAGYLALGAWAAMALPVFF